MSDEGKALHAIDKAIGARRVRDLKNIKLLEYAVKTAGQDSHEQLPRRQHVQSIFGIADTDAVELCDTYKVDPNEIV